MTMAEALADTSKLTPFEGKSVRKAGIEIPGAAGGLRESMKIEPQEFHQGEEVYVALKCVVAKVRFEPVDKDDPSGDQRRVHVLATETATFVDGDLVEDPLAAQAARIAAAKTAAEQITGQQAAFPSVDELETAHRQGGHDDGLVSGCPMCDDLEAEANATAD